MEKSIFSYSIGKFISNHTNVGSLWKLMGVSDSLIMETICSKSLLCVCFLCNSGSKSCFRIWDREQALVQLYSIYVQLCGYTLPLVQSYASQFCSVYGIAHPNSARVNMDGCFCRRYKDSCSNTSLTFICQATTISVSPQTPVWNLQS